MKSSTSLAVKAFGVYAGARLTGARRSESLIHAALIRQHAIALIKANVDFQIRETFESALAFSIATLKQLGASQEEAAAVCQEIRRRDAGRLELQVAGDMSSGRDLMLRDNRMTPTPLTRPRRSAEALSEETAHALGTSTAQAEEGAGAGR